MIISMYKYLKQMPRATQPIHVLRKHCLYIIYTFESSYCLQCSGTGTLHFYITNEPIDGANYAPETYKLTVTALLSNLNLMEISSLSLSLSTWIVGSLTPNLIEQIQHYD